MEWGQLATVSSAELGPAGGLWLCVELLAADMVGGGRQPVQRWLSPFDDAGRPAVRLLLNGPPRLAPGGG